MEFIGRINHAQQMAIDTAKNETIVVVLLFVNILLELVVAMNGIKKR